MVHLISDTDAIKNFDILLRDLVSGMCRGMARPVNLQLMQLFAASYAKDNAHGIYQLAKKYPLAESWLLMAFYSLGEANWNKLRGNGT